MSLQAMDLPEIRFLLAKYLDTPDLVVCVQVCRCWHDFFVTFLWREVVLQGPGYALPARDISYFHSPYSFPPPPTSYATAASSITISSFASFISHASQKCLFEGAKTRTVFCIPAQRNGPEMVRYAQHVRWLVIVGLKDGVLESLQAKFTQLEKLSMMGNFMGCRRDSQAQYRKEKLFRQLGQVVNRNYETLTAVHLADLGGSFPRGRFWRGLALCFHLTVLTIRGGILRDAAELSHLWKVCERLHTLTLDKVKMGPFMLPRSTSGSTENLAFERFEKMQVLVFQDLKGFSVEDHSRFLERCPHLRTVHIKMRYSYSGLRLSLTLPPLPSPALLPDYLPDHSFSPPPFSPSSYALPSYSDLNTESIPLLSLTSSTSPPERSSTPPLALPSVLYHASLADRPRWTHLSSLRLERTVISDETLAGIISQTSTLITFIVTGTAFGPLAFEPLARLYSKKLMNLSLDRCPAVTSSMVQTILTSFRSLRTIGADSIKAMDMVGDGSFTSWVCLGLLELRMDIDMDASGPEERARFQNGVYTQLSRLVKLETLSINGSRVLNMNEVGNVEAGVRHSLDLRLDAGLRALETLVQLQELRFKFPQKLEAEDVRWMVRHWPKLEKVRGILNSGALKNVCCADILYSMGIKGAGREWQYTDIENEVVALPEPAPQVQAVNIPAMTPASTEAPHPVQVIPVMKRRSIWRCFCGKYQFGGISCGYFMWVTMSSVLMFITQPWSYAVYAVVGMYTLLAICIMLECLCCVCHHCFRGAYVENV